MGGLFPKPRVPELPEPTTIPDVDDEEVQRARARETAQQRRRRGRQSTILTEGTGAGGREFSRTLLG